MNAEQRQKIAAGIRQFMKDVSMAEEPANEEIGDVNIGSEKEDFIVNLLFVRDVRLFLLRVRSKYLDTSVDDLQIYTRNDPVSVVAYLDEKCYGRERHVFNADTETWEKSSVLNREKLKVRTPAMPKQTRHLGPDGSVLQGPPGALTKGDLEMLDMQKKVIRTGIPETKIEHTYVESGANDGNAAKAGGSTCGTSQSTCDDDKNDKRSGQITEAGPGSVFAGKDVTQM